ncbi:hypothetical protein PENTCL1PPCAC_16566, partial [Pristionchus entomophagus]
RAVCFIPREETVPREGVQLLHSDSLSSCKLSCIRDPQCQSIAYSLPSKLCVFHGNEIKRICRNNVPYYRLVKTQTGCPQPTPDGVISNYVTNPCLTNSYNEPDYTFTNQIGICPRKAIAGDTGPRYFFVSVILHDGSYSAFDNNSGNRLEWNATLNSYVVYSNNGGAYDPVYAAMCVYHPWDGEKSCRIIPFIYDISPIPAQCACPSLPHNFRAGKWIRFVPPDSSGLRNSCTITAASCL